MDILDKDKDKDEFENGIKYFKSIINNNISKYSSCKMAATFIGIKTDISGVFKMHIYILFFPFPKSESVVPYSNSFPNIYFKDLCFDVDESFYFWIYQEMKNEKRIAILTLDSKIVKVVSGYGDVILSIEKSCKEKQEWMHL